MKLLLDFFPIILFFVAFKVAGIYVATAVAIVATIAQIAWIRWRTGKVEPLQWISLGVIVVFGGATLLAHSETFIKWKPTVLYLLFAAALAFTGRFTGKQPLKAIMGAQLDLPDAVWARLTQAWIGFFLVMAVLNLFVAYRMSLDAWVNFKLFGSTGLLVAFVIVQGVWLSRHMEHPSE